MTKKYARLTAAETLTRLKAEDYCEDARTAEILACLIRLANAGGPVAQLLLENASLADQSVRAALEEWASAVKTMREKGIL
jgi:hypothetical protein